MRKCILTLLCVTLLLPFVACEDNDETKPDNSDSSQSSGNSDSDSSDPDSSDPDSSDSDSSDPDDAPTSDDDLFKQFYQKLPMNERETLEDKVKFDGTFYDNIKKIIPTGNYSFIEFPGSDSEEHYIMSKGDDGSLAIYYYGSMQIETAFEGSSLYISNIADDGDKCIYQFYNDYFSKNGEKIPAPSYNKFEYLDRYLLFSKNNDDLHKIYLKLGDCFFPRTYSKYDGKNYKFSSEKTELQGIKCTHYHFTAKPNSFASEKCVQDWWLTDDFVCLKFYEYDGFFSYVTANVELDGFFNGGSFSDNYKTVATKYNIYREHELNSCLESHTKYANEWLENEYPDELKPWVVKFPGEIESFTVSRRAWDDIDNIVGISFNTTKTSAEEVKQYVENLRKLNLSNVYVDGENESFIQYKASNEDAVNPNLGETVWYPSYDLLYNTVFTKPSLTVVIDFVRLTGI